MSTHNYKAPVSASGSVRDAIAMSGGFFNRLGPKKGTARQQRRAEQRALRRQLRMEAALDRMRASRRPTHPPAGEEVAGG